jgi:hypothetical protein
MNVSESYHNENLMYTPQRKNFPHNNKVTREVLAVLELKNIVNSKEMSTKLKLSKYLKQWMTRSYELLPGKKAWRSTSCKTGKRHPFPHFVE